MFNIELKRLREFERMLDEEQARLERLAASQNVKVDELIPADFMQANTTIEMIDELFAAAGIENGRIRGSIFPRRSTRRSRPGVDLILVMV